MNRDRRTSLVGGLLLIVLGTLFLIFRLFPGVRAMIGLTFTWPFFIVAVGGGLFLIGLLTGEPEMAVPACVVAGIGGILYWQNVTSRWDSWAYVWTLIPGFAGVGHILAGVLSGKAKSIREGLETLVVSGVLFVIFASIFGPFAFLGAYWPVLLIALGVVMLVRALLPSSRRSRE
ncbi:MAG: hypothetical protein GVY30_10735 [Chloroflexi bacterium]|nr:hypothetical protein [Chloroflexota bacterium]